MVDVKKTKDFEKPGQTSDSLASRKLFLHAYGEMQTWEFANLRRILVRIL